MTSRGNPSISPPAQISQQRHGNALQSATPPPAQQYYPGQSPALSGGYELIASQQPLLPYQAYGSAVNDVRGQPGNGNRGGPPQQAMHQSGAAFYQQQAGGAMRPPQQGNQSYYISAGALPNNMRATRAHHPAQAQAMLYIPHAPQNPFPTNNMVVYPQRPQMNPGYYASLPQNTYPLYFNPNGANTQWQGPRMPTAGPAPTRPVREKKILEIKDPNTGKVLTDELINSAHAEHAEAEEEPPQNPPNQEISKLFTKMVVESLKSTEDSSTQGVPPDGSQMATSIPPQGPGMQASQQYQQPPPTAAQQPPHMIRPGHPGMAPPRMPQHSHMMHPRPGMMPQQQGQPPATPPHTAEHMVMNFSRPPPPLRQPTPAHVYSTPQQHLVRHPQQQQQQQLPPHQQQQQQMMPPQAMRQPNVPVMPPNQVPVQQQQQQPPVQPQPLMQQQQHQQQPQQPDITPPAAPAPVQAVPEQQSAPASAPTVIPQATHEEKAAEAPAENIPATKVPSPPAKEETPPPQQVEAQPAEKESSPPAEEANKMTEAKDDASQGASNRGAKDGRKGKKNKKDLDKKEIGGSDMDAFIDEKENDSSTSGKPPLPSSAGERRVSVDKPGPPQEAKPEEQVAAKEESPAPAAVAEAKPESTADKPPRQDEKASSVEEVTAPAPAAKEASPAPVVIIEPATEPAPPAAPVEEDVTAPTPAVNNQNQEEAKTSSQQESSPASEAASSSLPTNDVPSDNTSRNVRDNKDLDRADDSSPQTPVNDENIPPKELSLRPSMEDSRPTPPSRENSVDAPAKSPGDKQAAAKKEGKDNKLQYDRAYLMELRECPSSQTKPEGLPNLEIILDRPVNRAASGTSPDFTPNFFQPSTPQRHPQQMGKSASRGRARPGEMQVPQRVIKSVSIQNDVKALHQSEKPWKPSQKQLATGEISNKVENLESKALFILNRLTPTNFGPLSEEMLGLKINDYEQLEQLVKIFFDKVTLETKFVEAYAKLCKKMCSLKVPPPPGMKEAQASFRVLLLTKCQKEFESDKTVVFEDPEEKKKKLEAEMPEAPDKAEKIETILYHMKLRRLKFYGNIRFIGELFKLSMLTENIMHDCIFGLLKARDDESLLSLCQLISTVGQILDTDKAKQRMDQYFHQMIKIAEERKSRIKFTLKDAIELRRNNWVPRKETTGPKKIDEVRQDFHQEQQTKQFLQNQPPPPRNDPQPGSRRGSRQRQEEKPNDDGWNTVGSKSIRIDASKMKFSKSVVDENIQLGPGGGMNKFSMWSRGSGAASAQSAQDSPASRPANRFSALPSEEDRRFQRSPSRGETGGMGSRGMRQNTAGHGRGKMIGRSSIEGERRDALASARSIVGGRSHNSSRDNSWNRDDRRSLGPRSSREGENQMGPPRTINLRPSAERGPPPPQAAPAPSGAFSNVKKAAPKTEKEMEHSAKTIMDEYLNIQDMKEAKLCLMELEGQKHLPLFVFASINNVLERSDKERILTGQFFQEILKDNTLSLDNFVKGLGEVLQFAEDMVIDIPKMWTNLAQMMTPTLVGGSMPWTLVKSTLGPHLSQDCAAKLIAEILLIAKTLVSESEVARMWQSSGLSWEAFLPADRIADFVQMKKLEFLQGGADNTSPVSSQVNQEAVIGDLVKIIKDGKTNTDIVSFIKDKIPKDLEEKQFIRLLMTAVIKASLSPTLKPNMEVITERQEILQKYINNPNLELQALYAIQALMHCLEHPGGVIATVFEALYNEEVISEEAFKQWEVSSEEQEGKGTCCKQLTRFFTWLRENEDLEAS